jgi:hypothetical protein
MVNVELYIINIEHTNFLSFLPSPSHFSGLSVTFITMSHLQPPPTQDHEPDTEVSSTNGENKCSQCDRTFTRPGQLKRHLRSHNQKERIFPCDYDKCDRKGVNAFYRRDNLFNHQRNVHGDLSEEQKQQLRLRRHRRVGSGKSLSDQDLPPGLERSDGAGELNDLDMSDLSQNPNSREATTTERRFPAVNALPLVPNPRLVVTDNDKERVETEQDLDPVVILGRLRNFETRLKSLESWAFRSQNDSR